MRFPIEHVYIILNIFIDICRYKFVKTGILFEFHNILSKFIFILDLELLPITIKECSVTDDLCLDQLLGCKLNTALVNLVHRRIAKNYVKPVFTCTIPNVMNFYLGFPTFLFSVLCE